MARPKLEPLYIAVGGHAVCIDPRNGDEIWRTKLKGASYATIAVINGQILAGASGELFCLHPRTGEILWHNKLKGLGIGIIAFPGSDVATLHAAAAAAAAAAGAG
jgi:outer membrane protein assembly factor BamB